MPLVFHTCKPLDDLSIGSFEYRGGFKLSNFDSKDVHSFFITQDMLSFDKNGISVMNFCFCVVHLTESSGYLNEKIFLEFVYY